MSKYPLAHHENIYWRTTDLHDRLSGAKIFVVGHTGFYGSWFVDHFRFLSEHKGLKLTLGGGSRSTGMNIVDVSSYPRLLREADIVINCGGDSTVGSIEVHGLGPLHLRKLMNSNAVLLQFSSGAVGRGTIEKSVYALAKELSEQGLLEQDPPTKIVRPFATVGPGMGLDKSFAISAFIRAHLAGQPLRVTSRPCARSFCHITDLLVQCLHVLMDGDDQPYEVGSDNLISMRAAACAISDNILITNEEFPSNAGVDEYAADLTRVRQAFNLDVDRDSISAIMDSVRYYATVHASITAQA